MVEASRKRKTCEESKLDDDRARSRLVSSVVTEESWKVNFHIRDQAIEFQE